MVGQKKVVREVIGWNMGELAETLTVDDEIYIAFSPEFNEWQGRRNIQFKAEDVFKLQYAEKVEQTLVNIAPDRDIIVAVYCVCREQTIRSGKLDIRFSGLLNLLRRQYNRHINEQVIEISVKILQELKLLAINKEENDYNISFLQPVSERRDLFSSVLFRQSLQIREDYINKNVFQDKFQAGIE